MHRVSRLGTSSLSALLLLACNDDSSPADDEVGQSSTDTGADTGTSTAGETTGTDTTGTPPDMGTDPVGCTVDPSAEATKIPGPQDDGSIITVNGRLTDTLGENVLLTGLGADVLAHPTANVAYVVTAGRNQRHLYVIDRATQEIVQDLDRGVGFYGLELSPDGSRLYAANGVPGGVEHFDVAADGSLTSAGVIPVVGWTAGMAQNADGSLLWVASFDADRITEIDTSDHSIIRTFAPGFPPWDLLYLPGRDELWATDFGGEELAIRDMAGDVVTDTLSLPTSPNFMAVNGDESRVFVSVSGADTVVAIDTDTREIVTTAAVAEPDFVDAMGDPLPHSNPGALLFDEPNNRLFVARGSDSAVAILDAASLELLGSIPTSWYPTSLALSPDGEQLIASEARANGTRSNISGDGEYKGGASFVDLASLDLATATNTVVDNYRRPLDNAAIPDCGDDFPLPTDHAGSPVIEHVILIVNENQTFDALFGSSGEALGVEADPDFLKWEESVTVNKRALAARFVIADNFYTDAEESDSGHTFLTATHWTDFVERIQKDRDEYDVLGFYPTADTAIPDKGNFFSWVLDNDESLKIFGEIVGFTAPSSQGPVGQFNDPGYPGGMIVNYDVKDELKAQYVAEQIEAGELANFTFISLPNDHGVGIQPGKPTPPSMTADTDYAVGIIADALSHSEFWDKSVLFVLQDDPQGSDDHIDESRSPLIVISPWVRTGYVSHAHYSFSSVFATIERLLGVPPLGRPDAAAAPMYDMFTDVPNLEPYEAIPREYPEEFGDASDPGVAASRCMDFRSADRNPGLKVVTDNYLAWRRGELTAEQAEAKIAAQLAEPGMLSWAEEEAEEESFAFDTALREYNAMAEAEGWASIEPPAQLAPAADCPELDVD